MFPTFFLLLYKRNVTLFISATYVPTTAELRWSTTKYLFKREKCTRHDYVASIFLLFFNWGIHSVSLPFCRGWMWAHSDVSGQWDTGIQELSWDIPKLHSLWEENPSATRKTPDLENRRPGYWITEMRVQLPYHPEFFNIAWYVRDKAMVSEWTGESVSKRWLSKTQETSAFVLSSFLYSGVLFSVWEATVPPCVILPRLRMLLCCAARAWAQHSWGLCLHTWRAGPSQFHTASL